VSNGVNILDQMRSGDMKATPEEKQIANTFMQNKPCSAIIALKNREINAYKLSNEIDSTYSYTHKVCKKLRELGLAKVTDGGSKREKLITLTRKGERFADKLDELNQVIQQEVGQ